MSGFQIKTRYEIVDLIELMKQLRGDRGCLWDREQTHQSIRKNLIEETYEAVEAIDLEDDALLCEELGDLLLQVVFHSRIAEEAGGFSIDDVADGICKKLVLRHPHVFGEVEVQNANEVLDNWDEIKKREKGQKTATETLRSVSQALPALMRSQKVQKRAAKTGFDYPDASMALDGLESEVDELREALRQKDKPACAEEVGDIIFSAVNTARLLGLDAEECLTASCEKFISRFERVEELAQAQQLDMHKASITCLTDLWNDAKRSSGLK